MSIKNLEGATLSSRFRLERQLGRGGYGSVFEAEQLSVGRKCAVKVLAPKAGKDSTTESRFSQEARTTSQLNHPNSIVIYDFGRDDKRDVLWLAMELLDGETLQSRVSREGPLSVDRCLHVVRQAAESLHEAHEFGLVHRDIKPGNIMLLDRGGDPDFVKVIDFGIAKIVRETLNPAGNMTQTGRILGTPKYMAPEQIRDTSVDGRADIYALAIVVYAVLTANVPFSEGTAMEIASRQITERPPKIRDLAPGLDVSHTFESVLLQALSKDPNRRFEDILAFVDALEHAALPSRTDTPKLVGETEVGDSAAVQPAADLSAASMTRADALAETDDEIAPTTERMAGGSTPTADMGRIEHLDDTARAQPSPGAPDEQVEPQERGDIDVTLDTVAVESPRGPAVEPDQQAPREKLGVESPSESGGNAVRVIASLSVIFFVGAVVAWLAFGANGSAVATSEEGGEHALQAVDSPSDRARNPAGTERQEAPKVAREDLEDSDDSAGSVLREDMERAEHASSSEESADAMADGEGAGANADVQPRDEKPSRRRMTVRAIPWGELYIDGRRVGSGSKIDVTVLEGEREFLLKQNGEVRTRRTIDVSAGSPKIVELVAD
ncbi:MAG: serine/threonine protein kinase [Myxococcota bacterium]